jgi:hypothetical protein
MRNLVEISQAEAALTKTALLSSPIAARAGRDREVSPATH